MALQPMGSKWTIPEEMFQTLLTKKKQGNLNWIPVHADNIIKPTQTRFNREKYNFWRCKIIWVVKNVKTGLLPYLGLELTIRVINKAKSISWDSPFKLRV
jgi:hypothetical protein